MVTIHDVARHAGVSSATVSRMLAGNTNVSDKTKEKINNSIKTLGYKPNMLGRNLRTRKTKTVLAVLPNISNSFYSGIIRGIQDVCEKTGYTCLICATRQKTEKEISFLERVETRQADGAIILYGTLEVREYKKRWSNLPLVWCSEYLEGTKIPVVSINNIKASKEGVKKLISLGHKSIGFIGASENVVSAKLREEGYKAALLEEGYKNFFVEYGDYSYISGFEAANRLLAKNKNITAILAVSDVMAIGAINASIEMGKKVPEDISVMGFDNIGFSGYFRPSLSTIAQPRFKMGQSAMELLINRIENPDKINKSVFLNHEIIIRESIRRV